MVNNLLLLFLFDLIFSAPSCNEGENYCSKCNTLTNLCIKCKYDVLVPDKNGGCIGKKKCNIGQNYCEDCDAEGNTCSTCSGGYYPDENGGCTYSENCEISHRGNCLICKNDFVLIGQDLSIKICKSLNIEDFANCKEINYSTGLCNACEEKYYLNEGDKKCIEVKNCKESSFGKCLSCITGYYLDHKENRTCKSTYENKNLNHCAETEDGKSCLKCEDGYYLDEKDKCVNTNFCSKSNDFKCEECIKDYYLTEDRNYCSTTEHCYNSDKDSGVCFACSYGYYLDANDGKCKSNQEDDDLKYCRYYTDKCLECQTNYILGKDNKCSSSNHCLKSEFGICNSCEENYHLDLLNKCTNINHCIYSTSFSCQECEKEYFYNLNTGKCEEEKEGLENCKSSDLYGMKCANCKDNYYLLQTDKLCHSNDEEGPFYKCSKSDINGTKCMTCENNYYMGSIDGKCSPNEYCASSEDNICTECDEFFCLNVKIGKCFSNEYIEKEEDKIYFGCIKTNSKGTECEECLPDFTKGENGLCIATSNCEEEDEGNCTKCKEGEYPYSFCLNADFGCVENYLNENCLKCDDDLNFDNCTECKEGYKLIESEKYKGEFTCIKIEK